MKKEFKLFGYWALAMSLLVFSWGMYAQEYYIPFGIGMLLVFKIISQFDKIDKNGN